MATEKNRWAIVTTDKRGVFFGLVTAYDAATGVISLRDAQMCVYWSAATRGVVGLAATGPAEQSKVTRSSAGMELRGVTAVMWATDEAVERWHSYPWS